jgi:hypothetical protein
LTNLLICQLFKTSCVLAITHDELATEDPEEFKKVLRMNEDSFNFILALVDPIIRRQDINMREAISSRDRLTVTLRFLATGLEYSSLQHEVELLSATKDINTECFVSQLKHEQRKRKCRRYTDHDKMFALALQYCSP